MLMAWDARFSRPGRFQSFSLETCEPSRRMAWSSAVTGRTPPPLHAGVGDVHRAKPRGRRPHQVDHVVRDSRVTIARDAERAELQMAVACATDGATRSGAAAPTGFGADHFSSSGRRSPSCAGGGRGDSASQWRDLHAGFVGRPKPAMYECSTSARSASRSPQVPDGVGFPEDLVEGVRRASISHLSRPAGWDARERVGVNSNGRITYGGELHTIRRRSRELRMFDLRPYSRPTPA